jgi:uncharacterized membrane protein YfcA
MQLLADPWALTAIAFIGLLAGTLGGMLGVGGSIVMIPGLTLVLGYDQHLYQAAAMIANVAVSIPAAIRHQQAGALDRPTLTWMGPAAVLAALIGVWLSNRALFAGVEGGLWLGRLLAVFLAYVIYVNVKRLRDGRPETTNIPDHLAAARTRRTGVGSVMGLIAGLLGVGGGAIAVPLQQVVLKLPLRSAIGNSSAIICLSAALGAIYKNATLGYHGTTPLAGLALAGLLVPTAWIGGGFGATLTHRLPMRQVRIAFVILLIVAAWKMAAVPMPWGGTLAGVTAGLTF